MTYHQIMPAYLDFISVFGIKVDNGRQEVGGRNLRFTGFQTRNAMCNKRLALANLGRSGRAYELCYNLKTAALANEGKWSVRQAAFYHQFDVETGASLWISTKARLTDLKERIENLTGAKGLPDDKSYADATASFRSSLAVHLLYCHWSSGGWRDYIEFLDNKIESIVSI